MSNCWLTAAWKNNSSIRQSSKALNSHDSLLGYQNRRTVPLKLSTSRLQCMSYELPSS